MRDITNSKGKIFRHFKGDLYLVEDFVTHSETQEKMVLYRALYGNCGLFVNSSPRKNNVEMKERRKKKPYIFFYLRFIIYLTEQVPIARRL